MKVIPLLALAAIIASQLASVTAANALAPSKTAAESHGLVETSAAIDARAAAPALACEGSARISRTLANGARWDFCWLSRVRENLVLSDVHFTPPGGSPLRVLASASIAQLHVAYDDSDVTYSDVTQYGLGGTWLQELSEADCVYGERLYQDSRATACLWQENTATTAVGSLETTRGSSLNIYAVSQVGAYTYVISWRLHDNGAIEPGIGATGALQRSSSELELPFGRILSGDEDTLWLSHTHNYYWRLDFDLGESATDDAVSEVSWPLVAGSRQRQETFFDTEQARSIAPDENRGWQIHERRVDGVTSGMRWFIDPYRYGHRYQRMDVEPFSEHDFFVTVANDCERFASQNARFNPDCLNDVLEYADGESLHGEDLVVWHRVAFHHVPRNEDQRNMHSHWDGFVIRPLGLPADDTPVNHPPVLLLENRSSVPASTVDLRLVASDADGDDLVWMASNLPTGLDIDRRGRVSGRVEARGNWSVDVEVFDGEHVATGNFTWRVEEERGPVAVGSGGGGLNPLWLLPALAAWMQRHGHGCRRAHRHAHRHAHRAHRAHRATHTAARAAGRIARTASATIRRPRPPGRDGFN